MNTCKKKIGPLEVSKQEHKIAQKGNGIHDDLKLI